MGRTVPGKYIFGFFFDLVCATEYIWKTLSSLGIEYFVLKHRGFGKGPPLPNSHFLSYIPTAIRSFEFDLHFAISDFIKKINLAIIKRESEGRGGFFSLTIDIRW